MRTPDFESNRFAFYELRVGATLVDKRTNASVYFQPGDDADAASEEAAHCFECPEMYPGENIRIFNRWADQYF